MTVVHVEDREASKAGAEESSSAGALAAMARRDGIDTATRWFYERVRGEHAAFIAAVDNVAEDGRPDAGGRLGELWIVPGALYKEQPRFGSDGRVVREAAEVLGIKTRLVPVGSVGSVRANAAIVAEALRGAQEPVVLVSLSKGGADVRVALEREPGLSRKIRVWINICGLIRGTPISDSLLGTRWWQRGLLKGYLAYTRAHADFVSELCSREGSLLGSEPRLRTGSGELRVISIVGFPLAQHLRGNSAVRHARMARLGPNDGSSLLAHAIVPGSDVYPVWGADHFMRVKETPEVIRRILLYVEGSR